MPYQLVCWPLDWQLSPADVLRLVRDDPHPVALLGTWAGGSDIVAADPVRVCGAPGPVAEVLDTPLPDAAEPGAGVAFGGGWIGYLGFGLTGQFLPVPPAPGPPGQLPAWWFGYYDHVLRRDRGTGRWVFEALCTPGRAAALADRFQELSRRADLGGGQPRAYSCGTFRLTPSAAEHRAAVRETVSYIRRGDIFQANICLRLDAGFRGDPLDAFCHAVTRLDPPYAAFLRTPDGAVASLSPELFLRRSGTDVWSRPIKGTRARPAGEQAARRQRAALRRSAKDRAENVMIVDLMRNDLSRVCRPGSVQVPALLRAEAHPGVWHLVSDVRGTLPAGVGDGPLIAAAFPPGSVTGAPKVRALELIHQLEADAARGLHRGDRLPQPGGRPGAERGHPHIRVRGRPGLAGQRRRHHRPLRRRGRVPRVHGQGQPTDPRTQRQCQRVTQPTGPVGRTGQGGSAAGAAAAACRGRVHVAAGN